MMDNLVEAAAITLGAVAPTIIHADDAETYLDGKSLDGPAIEKAARWRLRRASDHGCARFR